LQTNKPITLGELVTTLTQLHGIQATLAGDQAASVVVSGVAPLDQAQLGDISFLANPKYRKQVDASSASVIIVSTKEADVSTRPRVITANPYAYFARVIALLFPQESKLTSVHPTATIDATASIGANVSVGPYAVIEAGATIEDGASIGAHCFVGRGSRIGTHSQLMPRVTVYHGSVIGAQCTVHAGVVIGADGFGFAPDFAGSAQGWLKVPQIGGVTIGDGCEIGANTTIDRGAMSDTIIGKGCILDNQIQIGHNCRIGDYTAIAGCTGIAGSTVIGKRCLIGGAAMLTGHLEVCDGTTILAGTFISKSISQAGVYGSAIPASDQGDWLKSVAQLRQLDALANRVRQLESRLASKLDSQHEATQ
jgi:UDP-3-O-[3-hydroxymyristoyl] glucosamine N-acyltransferase